MTYLILSNVCSKAKLSGYKIRADYNSVERYINRQGSCLFMYLPAQSSNLPPPPHPQDETLPLFNISIPQLKKAWSIYIQNYVFSNSLLIIIIFYLFIILSYEGLWTNFHLGDISVLVQDVDVIIRWDTIDTFLILRCRTPFTAHRSSI